MGEKFGGQPPVETQKRTGLDDENREAAFEFAKKELVERGMEEFRDILQGIDDYSIFASTGLYLIGKKYDVPDLMTTPGDLDLNVHSKESFIDILKRLSSHPGCHLEQNGGQPYTVSTLDKAWIVRGDMDLLIDGQTARYPFEVFLNSSLVPSEERFMTKIEGFKTLTMEGLQKQYAKNLAVEKRIQEAADEVIMTLIDPEVRNILTGREEGEDYEKIIRKLELKPQDATDFYKLYDELVGDADEALDPHQSLTMQVGAMKTKIVKRLHDLETISRLLAQ